jgi:hypothetical protein
VGDYQNPLSFGQGREVRDVETPASQWRSDKTAVPTPYFVLRKGHEIRATMAYDRGKVPLNLVHPGTPLGADDRRVRGPERLTVDLVRWTFFIGTCQETPGGQISTCCVRSILQEATLALSLMRVVLGTSQVLDSKSILLL